MQLTLKDWHREMFAVRLGSYGGLPVRAEMVRGLLCGPFGIFAGTAWCTGHPSTSTKTYSLVHMPSQRVNFTLPREGLCRQAAEELAACDLAWECAWAPGVLGTPAELEKAREIHRRWKSFGVRKSWGER